MQTHLGRLATALQAIVGRKLGGGPESGTAASRRAGAAGHAAALCSSAAHSLSRHGDG